MKKVTILIPCYNEEASLPHLYKALCRLTSECQNYEWEFLFVNDGSHDIQIIKGLRRDDKRVCYIDLSRNFGKETVMLASGSKDMMMYMPNAGAVLKRAGYTNHRDSTDRCSIQHILNPANVGDFRLLDKRCIDVLHQLRESEC